MKLPSFKTFEWMTITMGIFSIIALIMQLAFLGVIIYGIYRLVMLIPS